MCQHYVYIHVHSFIFFIFIVQNPSMSIRNMHSTIGLPISLRSHSSFEIKIFLLLFVCVFSFWCLLTLFLCVKWGIWFSPCRSMHTKKYDEFHCMFAPVFDTVVLVVVVIVVVEPHCITVNTYLCSSQFRYSKEWFGCISLALLYTNTHTQTNLLRQTHTRAHKWIDLCVYQTVCMRIYCTYALCDHMIFVLLSIIRCFSVTHLVFFVAFVV